MRIPDYVIIAGIRYDIKIVNELVNDNGEELFGETTHSECTIRLSKTAGKLMEEIFLHEVMHTIDYVFNNGELEEREISSISHGIYQLFKQLE